MYTQKAKATQGVATRTNCRLAGKNIAKRLICHDLAIMIKLLTKYALRSQVAHQSFLALKYE